MWFGLLENMEYEKLVHWFSQNYQWVFSGIGVLIVAIIVQRLTSRKESKHESKSTTEITRSALDHSPVATQTFHADQIHIGHAVATPPVIRAMKSKQERPNLEYAGSRRKDVFVSPWPANGICDPITEEQRKTAVHALVVKFENRVSVGGERITDALNVIAKLKFRHKNGATERDIDYGVWLNSPVNCTDVGIGDTRELVLLCDLDGEFMTFEDRRTDNRDKFYAEGFSYIEHFELTGYDRVDITLIDQSTQATASVKLKFWREGESICTAQL